MEEGKVDDSMRRTKRALFVLREFAPRMGTLGRVHCNVHVKTTKLDVRKVFTDVRQQEIGGRIGHWVLVGISPSRNRVFLPPWTFAPFQAASSQSTGGGGWGAWFNIVPWYVVAEREIIALS